MTACNCPQKPPDPACPRAKSSRQSGQQRQMPDVNRYWAGDVEQRLHDHWQNVAVDDRQRRILKCSGPSGTEHDKHQDLEHGHWTEGYYHSDYSLFAGCHLSSVDLHWGFLIPYGRQNTLMLQSVTAISQPIQLIYQQQIATCRSVCRDPVKSQLPKVKTF